MQPPGLCCLQRGSSLGTCNAGRWFLLFLACFGDTKINNTVFYLVGGGAGGSLGRTPTGNLFLCWWSLCGILEVAILLEVFKTPTPEDHFLVSFQLRASPALQGHASKPDRETDTEYNDLQGVLETHSSYWEQVAQGVGLNMRAHYCSSKVLVHRKYTPHPSTQRFREGGCI